MIKIRCRKNLLYLFIYYISSFIDISVIGNIILYKFEFNPLYACIYLHPLESIVGGLIVFLYQKNSMKKKEEIKYFGIKIIHNKKNIISDGKFKKLLLIFFAAYFNYYNLVVSIFYLIDYIPMAMDLRISSIQIISSSLICIYAFDFKIKKHHKVSLIIISIFMALSISVDAIFMAHGNYRNLRAPAFQYFISIYYYLGYSFNNCIEKYLVDTSYMNPFIILIFEGIFELIMAIFIPFFKDPFEAFKKKAIKGNLGLFIFLFILYILLQIVVNIYRIYCNVIYSPMARSLIDYLFNPVINIFCFFVVDEFFGNYAYFIITELICLVMSFFGCVFNEYIILYCCSLELETRDEIADRANDSESQLQNELNDVMSNSENDDDLRKSSTIISFDGYNSVM